MPPRKRNHKPAQTKVPKSGADTSAGKSLPFSERKHRAKDADFVILCKSLHVSDLICDQAWTLWKDIQESVEEFDTPKRQWGACLFVIITDADVPCFTVTQVLKAVSLNIKPFLELVRKMDVNLDTISSKVNSSLTRLEKKYDVMLALYQRFEKTSKKIFIVTPDGKEKLYMRNCWTMFLLAKGKTLQMEDDLVIAFQLLLCTLELFIKRCPPELLQADYKSATGKVSGLPTRTSRRNQSKAKSQPIDTEMNEEVLEVLCKENECNIEEVKNVYQTSFSTFLETLNLPSNQDFSQMTEVSQQYQDLYLKNKDIDGRLFLDKDETLLTPKVDVSQVEQTPKKNQPGDEGVLLPPPTPIRAAMTSIRLLRCDLPSSGDQPSKTLCIYFKNCTVDPTQTVLKRLETLGQAFSQKFGEAAGPHCVAYGRQRFALGVRLYYKVMEAMLKSEEKRLSVQNFSKLLNDPTFHTSLLACSLEVVMATYEESSFRNGARSHSDGNQTSTDVCFPWILSVLDLACFDFYKIIESFIKAEPTLSKDIIRHLVTCENLIMERIAWKTGSLLFELLRNHPEVSVAEQVETAVSFNQPLLHNPTAADLYLSPMRPRARFFSSQSTAVRGTSQPAGQSQAKKHAGSNSLNLFYRKLYRLAYLRLKTLCSCLLSSHPELEPIIWTLFQHTLQHEHDLMRDRHLDQIMMSAMYAVCKVKSVDLRFKSIVTAYKNMPNTNQDTFKRVLIADGQYDSIIVFYNQVFMQKLKTNILQYASARPPTLSPIPQIPQSPYKFPNSPMRVPGSNNVYISPLKTSRIPPGLMTPRARMLVSIGETFGNPNRFQKINQMVSNSDRVQKRPVEFGSPSKPLKRLRFDVDGQDETDGRLNSKSNAGTKKGTKLKKKLH